MTYIKNRLSAGFFMSTEKLGTKSLSDLGGRGEAPFLAAAVDSS
jgi:hypothetical protein